MTRFGGVPISVSMPPRLLAKASGISRRAGRVPLCSVMLTTIGIISATVPVLLTKAPIQAVTIITSKKKFGFTASSKFHYSIAHSFG